MRVLVTGGTGFIGRRLVSLLRERSIEVVVIGRQAGADVVVDLFSADVPQAIAKLAPTHVVHLAWTTTHETFWNDPSNAEWTAASIRLIQSAHDAGARRFVGAGTCAEYAWPCSACNEYNTRVDPSTLYGVSKDAFRRVAEAYAHEQRMEFAWSRMFFVYGPGEPPRKLISGAIDDFRGGRKPAIRDASRQLDFVFIEDVARGLADLTLSDGVVGAFNFGSGKIHSIRDAINIIAIQVKGHSFREGERVDGKQVAQVAVGADITKARAAFGYSPGISLEDGIVLTAESLLRPKL